MVCIFSIRTGYACLIWLVHVIFALAVTPTLQITSSSSATDRTTMIYNKSKHIGQGRQLAKPTSHEQVSFVWRLYVHFLLLTKAYMYVHVLLRCQKFLEARFCGGSTPKFRYSPPPPQKSAHISLSLFCPPQASHIYIYIYRYIIYII